MKTIFSLYNGALVLTEQGGVFTLSFDESLAVGGGLAAGVISFKGQGSLVLSAAQAAILGEGLLNGVVPAALLPLAKEVEGVANAAIASL